MRDLQAITAIRTNLQRVQNCARNMKVIATRLRRFAFASIEAARYEVAPTDVQRSNLSFHDGCVKASLTGKMARPDIVKSNVPHASKCHYSPPDINI